MNLFNLFQPLRNPRFAQLYLAQTISLLGDALTWVAFALLAFELAGERSGVILGTALTLRVTAFVLLSPVAGALADRINRKFLMVSADIARVIILCLLPFVTQIWQVYILMFLLNAFTAFFTPTFQASIPLVTGKDEYARAISLSGATNELLGVLGPGIAGSIAALIGGRSLFWLDGSTFFLSAILILTLKTSLQTNERVDSSFSIHDVTEGSKRLWQDAPMRYALLLELVAAISGAWILVNTVGFVKGQLALGDTQYGWVMAAFGIGATVAALLAGILEKRLSRTIFVLLGAIVTSLAILPTNFLNLAPLMLLWFIAGAGQNWVNLPTQTLIADRTPEAFQGRVYGAHFAWSHLWWAFAYPLAGYLGSSNPERSFLYGGLIALALLVIIFVSSTPQTTADNSSR